MSWAFLVQPDRSDERERVEAAGGRVINWHGSRVLGVLGTSRSIGTLYIFPIDSNESRNIYM